MPKAVKTLRYAFATNTTALAAATPLTFSTITLTIPETSGRNFVSVIMKAFTIDTVTSATSITSHALGIKLGAAGIDTDTKTYTITNSGEGQSFIFYRDVTSYFNTNFGSGTTQTCVSEVTYGAISTTNNFVELYITYEYELDSTNYNTRAKTALIPLDSHTNLLTNSLQNIGSNQIPIISTFLPESGVSIQQYMLWIGSNTAAASNVDYSLEVQIGGAAVIPTANIEAALISATWAEYMLDMSPYSTSSLHQFRLRSNNTTSRFKNPGGYLQITYTYNHSKSISDNTKYLNSVQLAAFNDPGFTSHANYPITSSYCFTYNIQETNPELKQSGILVNYLTQATITNVYFKAGSQPNFSNYLGSAGSLVCGQYGFLKRIDASGSSGSAVTLQRGTNAFRFDMYTNITSQTQVAHSVGGLLLLNYHSDISTDENNHNKTIIYSCINHQPIKQVSIQTGSLVKIPIPGYSYYINNVGYIVSANRGGGKNSQTLKTSRNLSIDRKPTSWITLGSSLVDWDVERGITYNYYNGTDSFNSYYEDVSDQLCITASRYYIVETAGPRNISNLGAGNVGVLGLCTFHNMTSTISGSLTGFTGNKTITVYKSGSGTRIKTQVTSSNFYNFKVFDNTDKYFVIASDGTNVGRSQDAFPILD